jgi:hypothetical protein
MLVRGRMDSVIAPNVYMLGFLVWEFPTMYISQRTRIAKYLGSRSPQRLEVAS